MIVSISAQAEGDLEAIGDVIAKDNPKRAIGFILELRENVSGLLIFQKASLWCRGMRRRLCVGACTGDI